MADGERLTEVPWRLRVNKVGWRKEEEVRRLGLVALSGFSPFCSSVSSDADSISFLKSTR